MQTEVTITGSCRKVAAALNYQTVPLSGLIDRVCLYGDHDALEEIHSRPLFQYNGSGRIRMVEFIDRLQSAAARQNQTFAEQAYDLTVDRFSRLPEAQSDSVGVPAGSRKGTDCRRYFGALRKVLHSHSGGYLTAATVATEEYAVATLLQRLIAKHYRLALMEARRSALMTRYVWALPSGCLTVLMPRSMVGSERRTWLERNVPACDPRRPGEQQRVQVIIDDKVGQYHSIPVADDSPGSMSDPVGIHAHSPWGMTIPRTIEGLAETVATEKAEDLDAQRPAVRSLGAKGVYHLVRRIFDDLGGGNYHPAAVAGAFCLSKATVSRFAGVQWNLDGSHGTGIPDLWLNTARVIGQNPEFIDVAEEFGVWHRIRAMLSVVGAEREVRHA